VTTISQVFDALQLVNAGIKGVKFAPSSRNTPNQLTPGQLPAAISWYTADDWTKGGQTHFIVEVYVAAVGQASPTLAMATCLDLIQRFRDTFKPLLAVDGVSIIRERHSHLGGFGSDGIHKTLHYAGSEYFGFSFRVAFFGL